MNSVLLLVLAIVFSGVSGCGKPTDDERSRGGGVSSEGAVHAHTSQNGGALVVIGDDEYHLELVREPGASLIDVYVLDGHMENYVRLRQPSFDIRITGVEPERVLTFRAVANRATGETEGDTALFQAEADWLKSMKSFDGVIQSIEIRSKVFENIKFNYPQGNDDHDH